MLRKTSKSLLGMGLALVAMGIISVVWPGVTLTLVAATFAVVAFMVGARQFQQAFASETGGPVVGHLLLGLVDLAAGVGTLVWPGITVLVLTLWIGAWAVIRGAGEMALAFQAGETAGQRAMLGIGSLLSLALGVVLFARPDIGAVTLAQVFGFFSLIYGGWSIALAASMHSTAKRIDSALQGV